MKKIAFILSASAVILSSSCSKTETVNDGTAIISLSCVPEATLETKPDTRVIIEDPTLLDKVTSYTEELESETSIKNVQFLIFDKESSELELYINAGDQASIKNLRITVGEKWIWGIVNGPDLSAVTKVDQIKNTVINLSSNGSENGFVMAGDSYATVDSELTKVSITVSRLVSRIALVSIMNNLEKSYGDLKIERIFISNVKGNLRLDGEDPETINWLNKEGRADEDPRSSDHIIDGESYKASVPELTYKKVDQTIANGESFSPDIPLLFYVFPNSLNNRSSGFNETYTAQSTTMTIAATVNGKLYYYPVTFIRNIHSYLQRNKAFSVGVAISGPGSEDPNIEVSKYLIKPNVIVSSWSDPELYKSYL